MVARLDHREVAEESGESPVRIDICLQRVTPPDRSEFHKFQMATPRELDRINLEVVDFNPGTPRWHGSSKSPPDDLDIPHCGLRRTSQAFVTGPVCALVQDPSLDMSASK